jgi:hypothetical protein
MLAIFPEITLCAQSGDVDKLIEVIRKYFVPQCGTVTALDAFSLVKNFGIPVRVDVLDYFGALAVRDTRGEIKASIVLNRSTDPYHQTFTLCHLLGHFVCHVQPMLARGEWRDSGFKETVAPLRRYAFSDGISGLSAQEFAMEDLADRFAAALLLPRDQVSQVINHAADPEKLSNLFGVSVEMVLRRLEDLAEGSRGNSSATVSSDESFVLSSISGGKPSLEQNRIDDPSIQRLRDVSPPQSLASRAVAAHTYSDVAQADAKPRGKSREPKKLKGMDRIREIARKLDKNGDQTR